MTSKDRDELRRVINGRRKQALKLVEARASEQLVQLDNDLGKSYTPKEFGLDDVVAEAEALTRKIDMKIAQRWKEVLRGKPLLASIFGNSRPSCDFKWDGIGLPLLSKHRAALRKAGAMLIDNAAKYARLEIERATQEGHEMLVRDALESSAATAFLENMPTATQLMPAIDILTLKPAKLSSDERMQIAGIPYNYGRDDED